MGDMHPKIFQRKKTKKINIIIYVLMDVIIK